MPKERTEEQAITMAPLTVRLGEKDYEMPILNVPKMAAWRKKMVKVATEIGAYGVSVMGLGIALTAFPEKLVNLVLAYDPKLPKKQILPTATEEQFAAAFSAIMAVAFPFMRQLSLMNAVLRVNQSESEKSTNSSSPNTASPQIM